MSGPRELHDQIKNIEQQGVQASSMSSMRQSARTELEDTVRRLRAQAYDIERLLESLPAKLPQEADEALWRLIADANRNRR